MFNHQNKLVANTPNEFADKLLNLKKISRGAKEGNRKNILARQVLNTTERKEILSKTDGHCHICGGLITGQWAADHVKHHSRGGIHKIDNYLPAHSVCNSCRWDYFPEEFQIIMKLGVWSRKQIRDKTELGLKLAEGFIKHEKIRLKRRKNNIK